MSRYEMNTELSPVPIPALDAVAPEVDRQVYGMPMFATIPTPDLASSVDFWCEGLGFIDLFSIPGRLVHLRRWTFQDVLLVPGDAGSSRASLSFACVPGQLDEIARRCEELTPGCTSGPTLMPWNSRDLQVCTPEGASVVMTAALPLDPDSDQAQNLREIGIDVPH